MQHTEENMSVKHEDTCINKGDRQSAYERVTHIGGKTGVKNGGAAWKITQEGAIQSVEDGT